MREQFIGSCLGVSIDFFFFFSVKFGHYLGKVQSSKKRRITLVLSVELRESDDFLLHNRLDYK